MLTSYANKNRINRIVETPTIIARIRFRVLYVSAVARIPATKYSFVNERSNLPLGAKSAGAIRLMRTAMGTNRITAIVFSDIPVRLNNAMKRNLVRKVMMAIPRITAIISIRITQPTPNRMQQQEGRQKSRTIFPVARQLQ